MIVLWFFTGEYIIVRNKLRAVIAFLCEFLIGVSRIVRVGTDAVFVLTKHMVVTATVLGVG